MPADNPWWFPEPDGSGVLVIGDQSTNGVAGRSVAQWEGPTDPGALAMPGDTWIADPAAATITRQIMMNDRSWRVLA